MSQEADLTHLDATQVKLLQEECILVDENDVSIGKASKKVCHSLENINKGWCPNYYGRVRNESFPDFAWFLDFLGHEKTFNQYKLCRVFTF